ncbi:MAG: transporter substrate-binding domain-containing protein [Pseudomonadota bacterium]
MHRFPYCQLIAAVLLCSPALPLRAEAETALRLASDDWCPYICSEDGKITGGFLVDVTARAMALSGYQVDAVLRPLNRAILETVHGNIQGVYAPPLDQRLRLSAVIAYSRACFYTRIENSWTYHGLASLAKHKLGVIEDYGYDDGPMDAYIARYQQHADLIERNFGDSAGTANLQKLLMGRYPVILEHEAVLLKLSKQQNATQRIRQAGCLEQMLPLTIGFAKNDARNEAWIHALDQGLHQLDASGEIKALRLRYEIPSPNP